MAAEEESMPSENDEIKGQKLKKMGRSALDSFTNLSADTDKKRLDAAVSLLQHLNASGKEEFDYALGRLVRGCGSSRMESRKGYFTALTAFLRKRLDVPVDQLLKCIEKELQPGGGQSKSESADAYCGRILIFGAVVRSGYILQVSAEVQIQFLKILIDSSKKRSYLHNLAFAMLESYVQAVNTDHFVKVWPNIQEEIIKPWNEQTIDGVYISHMIYKTFPTLAGGKQIINEASIEPLCNLLFDIPMFPVLKHPVYSLVAQRVAESSSLVPQFCAAIDSHLAKPTRNKLFAAIILITVVIENVPASQIPDVLPPIFITAVLDYFKTNRGGRNKDADFVSRITKLFDTLSNSLKDAKNKTKIAVIKKFMFYPGTFMFEKVSGSKLIQQITVTVDAKGVKKLSKVYQDVVTLSVEKYVSQTVTENWINSERIYAAQLMVKLLGHRSVATEIEWKAEQLKFFLECGVFKTESDRIGVELADALKNCFYHGIDQKLPKLEDLRSLLSQLVYYIHSTHSDSLNEEDSIAWKRTVDLVRKLEKKKRKYNSVFHTLLLNMGLLLFKNGEVARSSLSELHNCYDRIKSKKNGELTDDEPAWVEVMVDLFLNLLSHNSHLMRSTVRCVFPHLCPHLTNSALHQILDVLDPKNKNVLSGNEEGSSSDDDGDDSGDESVEEEEDEAVDDNETVSDKLRVALRDALGTSGALTDEESIDMDYMDEDEAVRLDTALAQAFKAFSNPRKPRKQSRSDEALTHFRIRVLDLIEIYLESEPSMLLCLEMIPVLFQILEFSIQDNHQTPLVHRLRACLKKLTQIKKFSSVDDVTHSFLNETLTSLVEKGGRSASVYQEISDKVVDCTVFIVRCSQWVPEKKSPLIETLKQALETFFEKRDCLLPASLFKSVLQLGWKGNWKLAPHLVRFAFDENVRPFRRNQALDLLGVFYRNNRLCSDTNTYVKKMSEAESQLCESSLRVLLTSECKEKFVLNLLNVLCSVKASHGQNIDWIRLEQALNEYSSRVSSKDVKRLFNKLRSVKVSDGDVSNGVNGAETTETKKIKHKRKNGWDSVPSSGKKVRAT